jgi:hypothetical protein
LPFSERKWFNDTTAYVYFVVSPVLPPIDGVYKFIISGASSKAGQTMDSTLSDNIKNEKGQAPNLRINRASILIPDSTKLRFPTIPAGTVHDFKLMLKNSNCANVTIGEVSVPAGFELVKDIRNQIIKPDSTLPATVRFRPTKRGDFGGLLKITYTGSKTLEIPLTGSARGPLIVLDPAFTITFPDMEVGSMISKTVKVTNQKAKPEALSDTLVINEISAFDPAIFQITQKTLTLAPDSSKNVTITFKPLTAQEADTLRYNGSAIFKSNDLTQSQKSLNLTGRGYKKEPPPAIPQITVKWPYGRANYINTEVMEICLPLTFAEYSKILQVRWKFALEANPPTAANDTTSGLFGGGASLRYINGCYRFLIPLASKLISYPSVRLYYYIWYEGVNGTSTYANGRYSSVLTYDITAPTFDGVPVVQSWTGVKGYTNADNIQVCWKNPSDSSGIREVRWKLTASPTDAPKDSLDYGDNKGGKFLLPAGANCVTIPLKGKILDNKWYCYMWLVDGIGNSGYKNAARFEFIYDTRPPVKAVAPFKRDLPLIPNISEKRWFGRPTERSLKLTLTLPEGATDAWQVFWNYKHGAIAGSNVELSRPENTNIVSFDLPFNLLSLCGDDTLRFWFKDYAGNIEPKNYASVRYRFDMCAPEIKRVSRTEAVAIKQQLFTDNITITDHYAVDTNSVTIYYRFGGTRVEGLTLSRLRRPLVKRIYKPGIAGDTLTLRLQFPLQALTSSGLEYRVVAKDSLDNSDNSEGNNWMLVRVRVPGDGESRTDENGEPVTQPNGTDSTGYRLISIPFWLDKRTAKDVLEDDLGPANQRTKWRLIEYRSGLKNPLVDHDRTDATIADFAPGRGFFLIVREPNKVIDSGSGVTVSTIKDTTLILRDGWNLIGNPFNFPISVEMLELSNSRLQRQIYSLEGTYTPHFSTIDPWKGYAIKVASIGEDDIKLRIPPISAKPGLGKTRAGMKEGAGEWTLQIAARVGAALDTINWVGARRAAADEYDEFDMVEPPPIGGYVSVYVDNSAWSDLAMEYTADFRPLGRDLYEWPIKVVSNYPSREVMLDFKGLASLPSGYEAYLIDDAYDMARNLNRNPSYRVVTGANGVEKSMKLLVGKPETLQKHSGGIALVPKAFELSQNFPNPFAAKQLQALTAIRYALPKSATVTVEVYNMLGQKVRTLVNRQFQDADYYMATWNGRDEVGKEVSSGVYVYRLLAESGSEKFAATKKLLLVK